MLAQSQPAPEPPVLVTVDEAARRLSIGRTAAYLLVLKGELQSVKIGRARRVVVASLND
ncbi:MAG TPA: helix-turn-helix domain-containing protein [Ktedonobacterales bacterium]